ncbi:MAG: type II secretion system protein [Planctomycetes bacterium]|nr:type II secretion system protein [Planctomycetota bacterium]
MVPHARHAGFTLVEVMVALGILSFVILWLGLGLRTDAIRDASQARNWRLAAEIAAEHMSEVIAGAREIPPESGTIVPLEEYPGFAMQYLVGAEAISSFEANQVGDVDDEASSLAADRLAWQRERDLQRNVRRQGISQEDYLRQEEDRRRLLEEEPSETEYEDVAVVIYFPSVAKAENAKDEETFVLKSKVSTLALRGLTPQQAEQQALAAGKTPKTQQGGASGSGGGGAGAGAGNSGSGAAGGLTNSNLGAGEGGAKR